MKHRKTTLLAIAAMLYFQWNCIGQGQVLFSENFESGGQGWTVQNQQVFQIGVPSPGVGPGSGHLSNNCVGTNLSGNYPKNSDTRLISPAYDLPPAIGNDKIIIRFWEWIDFGAVTTGNIQITQNDGTTWQNISSQITGIRSGGGVWTQRVVDLTQYADSNVRLRFNFTSSIASPTAGWYIDDFSLEIQKPLIDMNTGFEIGIGDWSAEHGVWEAGTPTLGPAKAHSGNNCIATVLGSNYPKYADSRLASPEIKLPSVNADEKLLLRFWEWIELGQLTTGNVQISLNNGTTWQDISPQVAGIIYGGGIWTQRVVDLTQFTGSTVRLGFYFNSSPQPPSAGWYIDDISVEVKKPVFNNPESFENGIGDWSAERGVWEVGIPTFGPLKAHTGNQCIATVVGGKYPTYANSRLASPEIKLPSVNADEKLLLRFWEWIELGQLTTGNVQISLNNGTTWQDISPQVAGIIYGGGIWTQRVVDLTQFTGLTVRLGFYFASSPQPPSAGWYIDDISVEVKKSIFNNPERFENGIGDWSAEHGVWEVGIPTSGPTQAHSGSQCLATIINGDYSNNANSRIISPEIILPIPGPDKKVLFRFWQWIAFESADAHGWVQISTDKGVTWQTVSSPLVGPLFGGVWTQNLIDLTQFAGQTVRLSFLFISTIHPTGAGWYIDDLSIEVKEPVFNNPESFEFGIGNWSADQGLWETGVPTSGPFKAHTGNSCIATVLNGNYPTYSNSRLSSPKVTLPKINAGEKLLLRFWEWIDFGAVTTGKIQISQDNGNIWQDILPQIFGILKGGIWTQCVVDLSRFSGDTVHLGFYFTSQNQPPTAGWYLDDISIEVREPDFHNPEGFELGIGDWSAEHGVWESGPPTSGPQTAHFGTQCVATVLNDNYPNYSNARIISPQFTVKRIDDSIPPSVTFWHWFNIGFATKGYFQVSVNRGQWVTISTYTGLSNIWQKDSFSLQPYEDSLIRIAFYITSSIGPTSPGWYIDDITFSGTCNEKNVGVVHILSPTGVYPPDTTLIPSVIVKNYSLETAVFPLTFQIGSEYTNDSIVALLPNQKDTIFFPPWSPAQKGTFIAKCRADWANDYCPDNNEQTANVTITPGNEPIITAIFPTQGGNTGAVTTEITGKFFQVGAMAFLGKSGAEIEAYDLDWVSAEKLFASFDLSGQETGFYDVKVRNPDTQQAIFKDGFEIVDGSIGWPGVASSACAPSGFDVGQLLEIEIIRPSSTRSNWIVPMTIHYRNTGNIDIPLPARILVSLSGAPIAFTEAGLSEKKTELFLNLKEAGGPANVLRAGASGSILIYTKSPPTSQVLQFKLME